MRKFFSFPALVCFSVIILSCCMYAQKIESQKAEGSYDYVDEPIIVGTVNNGWKEVYAQLVQENDFSEVAFFDLFGDGVPVIFTFGGMYYIHGQSLMLSNFFDNVARVAILEGDNRFVYYDEGTGAGTGGGVMVLVDGVLCEEAGSSWGRGIWGASYRL